MAALPKADVISHPFCGRFHVTLSTKASAGPPYRLARQRHARSASSSAGGVLGPEARHRLIDVRGAYVYKTKAYTANEFSFARKCALVGRKSLALI